MLTAWKYRIGKFPQPHDSEARQTMWSRTNNWNKISDRVEQFSVGLNVQLKYSTDLLVATKRGPRFRIKELLR